MAIEHWRPEQSTSPQEEFLLKRLRRSRKLFAFLRDYRHEIFDDAFQSELGKMYRSSGAGKAAVPPALLAMAIILQGYHGVSDAEAVELTVVDLRWQLVLGRLGETKPAFAQATLVDFRERLIRFDMDRKLLERTIEYARRTKAFDWKKLPRELRVAIDSSPLEGAGRVEDTINLLAHAARKLAECAADLLGSSLDKVATDAGIPLLLESSIKKALDIEWSNAEARTAALNKLLDQINSLSGWLEETLPEEIHVSPLQEHIATMAQIRNQDLEPDPSGGGSRIRQSVAKDRRISIEDADMRHGRKSDSKLFNGYKRHVATDLDTGLIVACALTPANMAEAEAATALKDDIARQKYRIGELYCDRGYISSVAVYEIMEAGGEIICKPWLAHNTRNRKAFTKEDFKMDFRSMTITCPAGEVEDMVLGMNVEFDAPTCHECPLRPNCTSDKHKHGRFVQISENEPLQHRLRKLSGSKRGRARLRQRTAVEHSLAHVGQRQGKRARYLGSRKNLFDLRRIASVENLLTLDHHLTEVA